MGRLDNVNHRSKVIKALERAGLERDEGGKHTIMVRAGDRPVTIPRSRRINPNLLRKIIAQCGLTVEEFLRLY